jgi:hypothetical protein
MDELKHCPFCGGYDCVQFSDDGYPNIPACIYDTHSGEETIERYNTRPIEDALNKRIVELEAANRWIPVGERLPEDKQRIIAVSGSTVIDLIYSVKLRVIFMRHYTYWMPFTLPEPPLEVK